MERKLPHEDCYWVTPGTVMAGRMPVRHDDESTLHLLTSMHRTGIRCFINLQLAEERDEQGRAFLPYWKLLDQLHPIACFTRFGIPDMGVPNLRGMRLILDHIDSMLSAGRPVYIHCWGGKGRTGTVVCCWLLRHSFATRDNIFDYLGRLRASTASHQQPSPETQAQRDFVLSWQPGM